MPLNDYQFQYVTAVDTLTFGDNGVTVPNVDVIWVKGLYDMETRAGDREFARFDGDVPALHRAGPRFPEFKLEIRGDVTTQGYWDLVDKARDIFVRRPDPSDTDGVLNFKWRGSVECFIRCRPERRRESRDSKTEYGLSQLEVQLRAADPRIYSATLAELTGQSGTFNVTNDGNDFAYPQLEFAVASNNAKITNNTNGDVFEALATTGSGNLFADFDKYIRGSKGLLVYRTSTDNYGKWTQPRKPFRLSPGTNSLTLNTGTSVAVRHRHTWI